MKYKTTNKIFMIVFNENYKIQDENEWTLALVIFWW